MHLDPALDSDDDRFPADPEARARYIERGQDIAEDVDLFPLAVMGVNDLLGYVKPQRQPLPSWMERLDPGIAPPVLLYHLRNGWAEQPFLDESTQLLLTTQIPVPSRTGFVWATSPDSSEDWYGVIYLGHLHPVKFSDWTRGAQMLRWRAGHVQDVWITRQKAHAARPPMPELRESLNDEWDLLMAEHESWKERAIWSRIRLIDDGIGSKMRRPSDWECWTWIGPYARGVPVVNMRCAGNVPVYRALWPLAYPGIVLERRIPERVPKCLGQGCVNPLHFALGDLVVRNRPAPDPRSRRGLPSPYPSAARRWTEDDIDWSVDPPVVLCRKCKGQLGPATQVKLATLIKDGGRLKGYGYCSNCYYTHDGRRPKIPVRAPGPGMLPTAYERELQPEVDRVLGLGVHYQEPEERVGSPALDDGPGLFDDLNDDED